MISIQAMSLCHRSVQASLSLPIPAPDREKQPEIKRHGHLPVTSSLNLVQ